ncbi:L-histidine N(alpha)-methyltransferase [Terrabacter sp. Soil810]|jgi:L-histidine N-alpha-methyltransferase|uniref:L-histidine N(alpha)-methyltransferase n=1 Tax=Terrabacter sp. Soil810 TaxID=1736418 RepID=UPI00070E63C2|nr:L-histidine N(alpha)-methyltransferase [Terrabacter sp. Soil810]KRF46707.1 dimethylhistidine N-methyltransferase [Terrabacter sp. Soil810]
MSAREPVVTVALDPDWASGALVDDVRRGLGSQPRTLPPKWLYDDVGSDLFDEITRLPEYYPTERERAILRDHAVDIVAACDATTVVELGSGTSDKTRTLLDAFSEVGSLERFVPVDVSEQTLRDAAVMLSERYPSLRVEALVGDFTLHLGHLPRGGRRLVAFLGGTIGNFYVEERAAFLGALHDSLDPGDWFLLGTDLVKSTDRLISAYDDSRGVTARFVTNCLRVLNRELGADFDIDAFSYVPFWDPRQERMDLRLRADMPQRVTIPGADLTFDLAHGEEIRVEISTKFRRESLRDELGAAGFTVERTWTDADGDFALTLARRDD